MNSVQLVGRLATEIDLKEVTGGSKVCSFILAVDRSAEEADFLILPTTQETTYGLLAPGVVVLVDQALAAESRARLEVQTPAAVRPLPEPHELF